VFFFGLAFLAGIADDALYITSTGIVMLRIFLRAACLLPLIAVLPLADAMFSGAVPAARNSGMSQSDPERKLRERMVREQIAGRGVKDAAVLRAMREVPRHQYVPRRVRGLAYEDQPLPIGHGQTISQPYIVAFMTEIIRPRKEHVVLEIGTGSGYQAAVLSRIVKRVYTVEIVEALAESAAERLKSLGCANVTVRHADGYNGWKEHAPYDAIVVTAAAEHIPPPLIAQLKEGGSMIIPVGSQYRTQYLMLVEKRGGEARTSTLMPVRFVPLTRGD
jgi:protein-L-isoaspartate(D-aspartate) O-methyltransferase